jgi:5'-deoxynucleotidase YfbR-like HD superfamily hydrolase
VADHGPFILDTYSGHRLDLDAPSPRDIRLKDIAAALSKVCRFGAQSLRFHSVAQHAVLVMRFTAGALDRPDLALWALHHDSHEAYTCDIPRPLKLKIRHSGNTAYDDICESLDTAIAESVGARRPMKGSSDAAIIDRADDMALIVEARSLLVKGDRNVSPKTQFTPEELSALPALGDSRVSEDAEAEFLAAHRSAAEAASSPR